MTTREYLHSIITDLQQGQIQVQERLKDIDMPEEEE